MVPPRRVAAGRQGRAPPRDRPLLLGPLLARAGVDPPPEHRVAAAPQGRQGPPASRPRAYEEQGGARHPANVDAGFVGPDNGGRAEEAAQAFRKRVEILVFFVQFTVRLFTRVSLGPPAISRCCTKKLKKLSAEGPRGIGECFVFAGVFYTTFLENGTGPFSI